MMRAPFAPGLVLTALILAASAGSSQDAGPSDGGGSDAGASDVGNVAVAYEEDGRYFTAEDVPTFHIGEDGMVDWLTYSGFRRYHAECHVCHGPDGEGSSYAPALKDSILQIDYYEFYDIVVNGRHNMEGGANAVMPAFGDNANVMCYLDDIYVYLAARGAGDLPRGRPASREDKSAVIGEDEDACLGT